MVLAVLNTLFSVCEIFILIHARVLATMALLRYSPLYPISFILYVTYNLMLNIRLVSMDC